MENVLSLNLFYTMAAVVIVYLIGKFLVGKILFLQKYCIPAPVVGGLTFAIVNTILTTSGICTITIDTSIKNLCMLIFFVSVGLQARIKILKTGGIQVILMLAIVTAMCCIQCAVGTAVIQVFGEPPLLGPCLGSIPLIGGHATAASFGNMIEHDLGVANAEVVATAAATFGLVSGCLIGGPVARRRIEKHHLSQAKIHTVTVEETTEKLYVDLRSDKIMLAVSIMLLMIGAGSVINSAIASLGVTMNMTVGVIIAGAILKNILDFRDIEIPDDEINAVANVGLQLFLAMAMMDLKLWQLVSLAFPMVVTLLIQTVLMVLFAYFVIFNLMGRDYEAAVMSTGVCGFGMGATPNAVANMEAVVSVYEPAPRAFLVVPIIGSMLVDLTNALVLTGFINFLR